MRALRAVLGLLLLGVLRALPQGRVSKDACAGDSSRYYNEAAGKCCYRCPEWRSLKARCPAGPDDCRKLCDPDYYLDRNGRCTACVSCSGDDLVEKKPCSWNSTRVCECRTGMFCDTSAINSCARCLPHSVCPTGMVVKFQGTAQRNTVCELPSPGATPNCSASPQDCKAPASTIPPAKPTRTSPASSEARTTLLGGGTPLAPEDAPKITAHSSSSTGKLNPDPGLTLQQPCPQGSADCRKQCDPDYYLGRDGRCTACVSCSGDHLVEKTPCMWNSSRVCECRPGMFCATSASNSCARCVTRPICPPGMVTKLQGVAERDTTHAPPPPGTHSNCSANAEDSRVLASPTPSPISLADSLTGKEHGGDVTHVRGRASISTSTPISFSSTGKPTLVSGPVLFWVILTLVVVVSFGSLLLCHRRGCRKWTAQKLHLCYPVQTFQPKLEPVDSRPGRNLTLIRRVSVAEPGSEEQGLMSPPAVETCPNLESLQLLEANPASSPSTSMDLPEPRGTTEHTNNRIENIYIMKAETVIVGTVEAKVPEGQGPVGPAGPEFEEDLEVDHAPHYPEQETEPLVGSCGDVMFSVEEEGKEDPLPTAASGK
ncbi:tumor necrosis factor receptor superfamily member 8 [Kogia breviceps]|uniref:tumor necrosis factor receptor superfamily member 8 n=1 Tax=Kogia breviceps TaxID=27615 RepID=UPI0034D32E03